MSAFAETQQCRMTAVIRHFGDTADAHRPCGKCDFCSPSTTSAQTFIEPTPAQARDLRSILAALAHAPSRATGKLHTDLAFGIDRKEFDVLLDALARAGLITLTAETFTNSEGKVLPYKKAALTHEGRSDDASELTDVVLPSTSGEPPSPSPRKRKRAATSGPQKSGALGQAASSPDLGLPLTPAQQQLDNTLRAWRKSEAAKTGKPAFIVLSDAVIRNLAIAQPQSIPELLTVSGIGPNKADQFGTEIISICQTPSNRDSSQLSFTGRQPRASSPKSKTAQTSGVNGDSKLAPASRYAKPSGLALSSTANEGALAPEASSLSSETFHRTRITPSDPTASLTPDQQILDAQLRAWRKAESERIGLPQFFILGSSALRSIVLLRPRTIAQLQAIAGIGPDKAEKFGASILNICGA
jgi:ATP-dependent DNA helicase RecQ